MAGILRMGPNSAQGFGPLVSVNGPPGTGKTTLAKVIANTTQGEFLQINATSAGKKDMEEVVAKAKENLGAYGKKTGG